MVAEEDYSGDDGSYSDDYYDDQYNDDNIDKLQDKFLTWINANCPGKTGNALKQCIMDKFDNNPKDGKIDRDELKKLLRAIGFRNFVGNWADGVLDYYDTNGNGMLDDSELIQILRDLGLYPSTQFELYLWLSGVRLR